MRRRKLDPAIGEQTAQIRAHVKAQLFERDIFCRGCGDLIQIANCHMHEGMISRGDVQGWPRERRHLIFSVYNCTLLCSACNTGMEGKSAPDRRLIFDEQFAIYGAPMIDWLIALPFKHRPAWLTAKLKSFGVY